MENTKQKEILENIINVMEKTNVDEWEIDKLVVVLNYINELEKECIRLKEIAYNLTTATVCGDWKQIKNTAQYKLELAQQRIDKVIKDLELTKEKNVPFLDKYGNALIYIDIDHIDYLIKILKGEDNENN